MSPSSAVPGPPRESKRRGELAELAFLHQATSRGLKVSKPYGDSGRYDFIVDTGRRLCKIQVKSTSYTKSPNVYGVSIGRNLHGGVADLRSQVDFIVIHIVPGFQPCDTMKSASDGIFNKNELVGTDSLSDRWHGIFRPQIRRNHASGVQAEAFGHFQPRRTQAT